MIKKINCIDNDLRHLKHIFENLLMIEKIELILSS